MHNSKNFIISTQVTELINSDTMSKTTTGPDLYSTLVLFHELNVPVKSQNLAKMSFAPSCFYIRYFQYISNFIFKDCSYQNFYQCTLKNKSILDRKNSVILRFLNSAYRWQQWVGSCLGKSRHGRNLPYLTHKEIDSYPHIVLWIFFCFFVFFFWLNYLLCLKARALSW